MKLNMMTDTIDVDAVSLTSSCEIVEALEDAVNDSPEAGDKEDSPPVELSWLADGSDSMTGSQYAQVIFQDIRESYPIDLDLEVSYTLTSFIEPGHGDRVALYKLPYLQPHEYVAYVWGKIAKDVTVKFAVSVLPKEEDFYQFQYLKGDDQVAGASVPFQLRSPGRRNPDHQICGVREEDDLLVVQTAQTSLQDKYSSLLDLSEKLTEELKKKDESFIVLEQRNHSLLENNQRSQEMEEDLKTLIADKLQLGETLTQTSETLAKTESVLEATTDQLKEVEKALELKVAQVASLQQELEKTDNKSRDLLADVGVLKEERDKLASMLEVEIKGREQLMKEKQELVEKLEDVSNMLNAAAKSKDLAIGEIRTQIEQRDKLRQELAKTRQEKGNLEAELFSVKQQLESFTGNENDSYVVTTVLSSLGEKLEAKDRELKQKDEEIDLLKQLEASKESLVIHEKCLEDADSRAALLESQNKELVNNNEELSRKVEKLQTETKGLKARLQSGALHYKKLAAERNALVKQSKTGGRSEEAYQAKIEALEKTVQQMGRQLEEARSQQELTLSNLSLAESISTTSGLPGARLETAAVSLDSASTSSNQALDSVHIEEAVMTSSQAPRVPMPSLFQPFPPTSGTLPTPLMPENIDPTTSSIPELSPRVPAPYSFTQPEVPAPVSQCPICEVEFTNQETFLEIQQHVNQHIDESYHECPVCNQKFGKDLPQAQFEDHVQQHFSDQLSLRAWDLGID